MIDIKQRWQWRCFALCSCKVRTGQLRSRYISPVHTVSSLLKGIPFERESQSSYWRVSVHTRFSLGLSCKLFTQAVHWMLLFWKRRFNRKISCGWKLAREAPSLSKETTCERVYMASPMSSLSKESTFQDRLSCEHSYSLVWFVNWGQENNYPTLFETDVIHVT